jgi:hypothetical protein
MRTIRDETFESFNDIEDDSPNITLGDVTLERCTFKGCVFGCGVERPAERGKIHNVVARDCTVYRCSIETAIIEDVTLENLRVGLGFTIRAAAYRHVKFRGDCRGVQLTELIPVPDDRERIVSFHRANVAFYEGVDWALDISEVDYVGVACWVPARLIRRDPERQVVVRREKVDAMRATFVAMAERYPGLPLINMGLWDLDEMIVSVSKRAKNFKELMEGLQELRDTGLADPD